MAMAGKEVAVLVDGFRFCGFADGCLGLGLEPGGAGGVVSSFLGKDFLFGGFETEGDRGNGCKAESGVS